MTQFTYQDEYALVCHLTDYLENRLAGRDQSRIVSTVPSDHCHLGVLMPRDPELEQPAELPTEENPIASSTDTDTKELSSRKKQSQADDKDESEEDSIGTAENAQTQSSRSNQEVSRRPPSALGFEILVMTEDQQPIKFTVSGRFAIYTQHFPTFDEQVEELGKPNGYVADDSATQQRGKMNEPDLLKVFQRWEVDIAPLQFVITPNGTTQRFTDEGQVQRVLQAVIATATARSDIKRPLRREKVRVEALGSAEAYTAFIQQETTGDPISPPLKASIDVRAVPGIEGGWRIKVYLRNDTLRNPDRRSDDQLHVLADAEIKGFIDQGKLVPIELLPVARDYQFDREVWAVGHSTSAVVNDDKQTVQTKSLARFEQPRRTTSERVSTRFNDLIENPLQTLESIRLAMEAYARDWQVRIIDSNSLKLQPELLDACRKDLEGFREEQLRFAAGIAALRVDNRLLKAFVSMNRVFERTANGRYDHWRLFQVVFIITQLPVLALRENILQGEWPEGVVHDWSDALDWGDVLWFPTGGGKTEAYLGLISCAALYDRLRGKTFGVTAWLRFPLRMLSVQQLARAAKTLWETEVERKTMLGIQAKDSDPISLGYFVGASSTPNRLSKTGNDKWALNRVQADPQLREKLLLVSDCPACGGEGTVEIKIDTDAVRIRHVCSQCHQELPVYVSDEEVYRFLPTLVIGTVDKMATVAYNPRFGLLWGAARWKCQHPEHGYGFGTWCVFGCDTNIRQGRSRPLKRPIVTPYDPSPTFHVQDELHLLQEELGAFAGHYETLVRHCETQVGGQPAKVIAATATVEGFEHQVHHLYGVKHARRFPGRGYDELETFYTCADKDPETSDTKVGRLYLAFRPPHLQAADAAFLCTHILQKHLIYLWQNPYEATFLPNARTEEEVRKLLNYYVRTLTYVGSKRRGLRVRANLDKESGKLRPGDTRDLSTEFLSGDSSLANIAQTIRKIQTDRNWGEEGHVDALVATSVISHGVDVEQLNVMVMDGIPEEIADYIQASSRSGRRHVGLVLSVLAAYSIRASSIYQRFREYHQHMERMVSPVSVNRFAKYASSRTALGIMLGLLLGRYGPKKDDSEYNKHNRARDLINGMEPGEFEAAVHAAYGLDQGIYARSLELSMIRALDEEIHRFEFAMNSSPKDSVTDAIGDKPMTSLRDVDAGIRFQPNIDYNYQDLRWFG